MIICATMSRVASPSPPPLEPRDRFLLSRLRAPGLDDLRCSSDTRARVDGGSPALSPTSQKDFAEPKLLKLGPAPVNREGTLGTWHYRPLLIVVAEKLGVYIEEMHIFPVCHPESMALLPMTSFSAAEVSTVING